MHIDNLGEIEIVGTYQVEGANWIEIETPYAFSAEGEQLLVNEAACFIGEVIGVVQHNHGILLRADTDHELTTSELEAIGRAFLHDLRTALSPPRTHEWEIPLYIAAARTETSLEDVLHPEH